MRLAILILLVFVVLLLVGSIVVFVVFNPLGWGLPSLNETDGNGFNASYYESLPSLRITVSDEYKNPIPVYYSLVSHNSTLEGTLEPGAMLDTRVSRNVFYNLTIESPGYVSETRRFILPVSISDHFSLKKRGSVNLFRNGTYLFLNQTKANSSSWVESVCFSWTFQTATVGINAPESAVPVRLRFLADKCFGIQDWIRGTEVFVLSVAGSYEGVKAYVVDEKGMETTFSDL